ncbi:hypothetical protein LTS17_001182 [Exophiala oligosperma]
MGWAKSLVRQVWPILITSAQALSSSSWAGFAKNDITLLGPVYQPSSNLSTRAWSSARQEASGGFNQMIETGLASSGVFDNMTTSFSASVFSVESDSPLFEFHFEAPGLNGSLNAGKLSENTIYRTGSLGKLLVAYTWLVNIGHLVWFEPITKYIHELAEAAEDFQNPLLQTNWSEVTIGSLMSQLSGLGRDYSLGDYSVAPYTAEQAAAMGFPPLANGSSIECSALGPMGLPGCRRDELLQGIINHPPSFRSFHTPFYSNIGFEILGLAYENITGNLIAQDHDHLYRDRLGMKSTSYSAPGADADTIIPMNDTYAQFSYSLAAESPTGNQYTSTKDLRTLGQAILKSTLLPPVLTRQWLKPATATGQTNMMVGAPWEIVRYQVPVNNIINANRTVDVYCKSGDYGKYSSLFCLAPDYNIGLSVLLAGEGASMERFDVGGILIDNFLPAAEAAAKESARTAFPGTFRAPDRNSSVTLAVDGGPGVAITSWTSNGTDLLVSPPLAGVTGQNDDFRLYPTGLSYRPESDELTYHKYHLIAVPAEGKFVPGWFAITNHQWLVSEVADYDNLAVDAVVVGIDAEGLVQTFECQALRSTYVRV